MPDWSPLTWILAGGAVMSAIALVGGLMAVLGGEVFRHLMPTLVAFAAGSLLGGAFLHLVPHGLAMGGLSSRGFFLWLLGSFSAFFGLELGLRVWLRRASPRSPRAPVSYLVLLGDAVHNFAGGLAVGGAFIADPRLGLTAWVAAAAHEIPQELGDFGILVHGGWPRRQALLLNLASALTFPLGGVLAWLAAGSFDVAFLIPVAAGSFIYIGASDLVPEIGHREAAGTTVLHFSAFVAGWAAMTLIGLLPEPPP